MERSDSLMKMNTVSASTPRRMQAVGVSPRYVDQSKKARLQQVKEMKKRHASQVAATRARAGSGAMEAAPARKKSTRKKSKAPEPPPKPDYSTYNLKDLKAEAEKFGLDPKGKKKVLVARLRAYEPPPPEPEPKKKRGSRAAAKKAMAALVSPRISKSSLIRSNSAADVMMKPRHATLEKKGMSVTEYLDEVGKNIDFGDQMGLNDLKDMLDGMAMGDSSSEESSSDDEFYSTDPNPNPKPPRDSMGSMGSAASEVSMGGLKELLQDTAGGDAPMLFDQAAGDGDTEISANEKFIKVIMQRNGDKGIAGLAKVYKIMDKDHSGDINESEFSMIMKKYQVGLTEEEASEIFNLYDDDDSGTVSFDEFLAGLKFKIEEKAPEISINAKFIEAVMRSNGGKGLTGLAQIFRSIDTDRSGLLELNEFLAAVDKLELGLTEDETKTLFKLYDTDGDGAVDLEEFLGGLQVPLAEDEEGEDATIEVERPKSSEDWDQTAFRNAKNRFIMAGGDPTSESELTHFYAHVTKAFGKIDTFLDRQYLRYVGVGLDSLIKVPDARPDTQQEAAELGRKKAEARAADEAKELQKRASIALGETTAELYAEPEPDTPEMASAKWIRLESIFLETLLEMRDYYYLEKPDADDMEGLWLEILREEADEMKAYQPLDGVLHEVDSWLMEALDEHEEDKMDPFFDAILVEAGLA